MFNSDFPGTSFRHIVWYVSLVILAVLLLPWSRSHLADLGLRWLYIFLFSFSVSAILTPVMRLVALKLNIVDVPGGRKIHEKPTPLLGGVAIVVAFSVALLANMVLERDIIFLLCGGVVVALMGLMDDWRGVSARLKLFVQILIVLILIHSGIVLNLFPNTMWGCWLNVLFTILWIIGITNAMNFIDGMDGLASGIAAIMAMFIGVVAFQTGQPFMGWIAVAMMGSCLGFLPFNAGLKRPASIYLGDAGSTFIGFMLAVLAIKGDWSDSSRIVSFSAPVLIFWILIYDMPILPLKG